METRKICVVITARASYARIKSALTSIKEADNLELFLVVAASGLLDKYGNVVKQIETDGFTINAKVYSLIEGETLLTSAKTTGLGIIEISSVLNAANPDVVITIADRYETISTAITAAYMNIPLVHIQGGEVTGNIDEKVRHAITKLADYHFVATEMARERVFKMGEELEKIYVTGCPSIDLAARIKQEPLDFDPVERYIGVGKVTENYLEDYMIVMLHPDTTMIHEAANQVKCVYSAVKNYPGQIYWFWPNVDAGSDLTSKELRKIRERYSPENILFIKNMKPEDFLVFLNNAKWIIGNSSVAIREGSYLGTKAINLGKRQNGREHGKNVFTLPFDSELIGKLLDHEAGVESNHIRDELYGDGTAGDKIANLLSRLPLTTNKQLRY